MRVLALILMSATSLFAQTVPSPGPGIVGSHSGSFPTNFAYIASSVTGCYNVNPAKTSCAYNLHVNPTTGHLLVVSAIWKSTTATLTFSCTNNTTWTAIGSQKVGTGTLAAYSSQSFYIAAAVTGASPELCNSTISSAVDFIEWETAEYSYTGTLSSLDGTPQYANVTSSGSVATISGLTTSGSSDLIFAACYGTDNSCSAGSGYTSRNDTNACASVGATPTVSCSGGSTGHSINGVTGFLIEEKTGVAAGAQTATFATGGATDNSTLGLIGF